MINFDIQIEFLLHPMYSLLKDAAIREIKEEYGLDIEVTKFCGVFQNVSMSTCNTLFLGTPIRRELTTNHQ